jgi:hypothetical protein
MLTLEDARQMVASQLEEWNEGISGPEKLVILDEHTIERSWGWVFFWTSQGWRDGDISYALGGNAPFIVDRQTGTMHVTGTADPVEFYIENYELTGDPHTCPGRRVVISASETGADVIAAVKLLREFSELSVGQAKRALDAVAEGKSFVVQTESSSAAQSLCCKLGPLGFNCHQQSEPAA